ncbi:hypothetical protein MACK_003104 [Theileria orientalis]|uniref:AP2/ERF domain-containing protein n=1 Tax=Theileria orientalis TaxID=68886 RepID=A0A976QU74_THEOR|nr:hypothetical protein MACK_003104 [Theileria orientalis]
MNFYPDSVDTKAYVGSLVTNYDQKSLEDCSQKTTVSDYCFDPLTGIGTCFNSPSDTVDLKRDGSFLDDLDTNSVPDTDYVPEFFDIYGSSESLHKVYSGLGLRSKWDESLDFKEDDSKEVDTTTSTTLCSDSGFKLFPFASSELFFEDDFRYVTSKSINTKYNLTSDIPDKNEQANVTQNLLHSLNLDEKVNYENLSKNDRPIEPKSLFQPDEVKKEGPLDKADPDSQPLEYKVKTENSSQVCIDGPPNENAQSNTPSNNLLGTNLLADNLFINSRGFMTPESSYLGVYDIMAPVFFNGPVYNMGALMEADLYIPSTLCNRHNGLISRFPVNTNYCVYRGADYNKLVCSCNMSRVNGSNSHSTSCNVVAGGVELSTESWPISKASQMYSLITNWDRVMKKYKRPSPTLTDFNAYYVHEECNPPILLAQTEEPKLHASGIAAINFDNFKSANYLISEITGIKLNIDHSDQFSLSNIVPDSYKPDDMTKRRKTSKNKSPETLTPPPFPTEVDLSSLSPSTEDDGKLDKKDLNQQVGEKVSGVWYDTNRHLWRVVYMKGNKRRTQGFSSLKLGYEEARRKAIQMRYEMVSMKHTDRL